MARALENPDAVPGYLDFFGMSRAPFARLSEPTQVFHAEQYSLVYDHLSDATDNADRLVVLCGVDGSGKTTLLNRYVASLGPEASFATFDETCVDGIHFYCGLLGQLGFSDITGTLSELRHISREFLIHRSLAADPVLIIIDNAHLVSPSILEQLRWLADIKLKNHSVISLVLSGNSDLTRIMASPAMSLLEFGRQIAFNIRVFTEQETDEYVRHRLRLAGGSESAKLSTEARPLIHRFSGGNPRLINRLCNAVLSEALAQETRVISDTLVRQVAEKHKFVPHVLPLQGQGRRKSDRDVPQTINESQIEERISPREAAPDDLATGRRQIDVDVRELLTQVSRLSDELGASRTQAEMALLDVAARDSDINAMLGKIAEQRKDLEETAASARAHAEEIARLSTALRDSQKLSNELNDDLKAEKRTAKKAKTELGRASKKLEKLEPQRAALQASIRDLKAEHKKSKADARRDLKARDRTIAELEKTIASLHKESESLRIRATEADKLEEALAKKEAFVEDMQSELNSYVEELTATQAQLAGEATGSHGLNTLPDLDMYAGDIRTIEVFRNGALDQVFAMHYGLKRLMIGRSDDSELCLKSKFVSRHHALIFLAKERAYIEDLRSYNGTIVNGKKISRCDLNPDDSIMIGDFELRPRQGQIAGL